MTTLTCALMTTHDKKIAEIWGTTVAKKGLSKIRKKTRRIFFCETAAGSCDLSPATHTILHKHVHIPSTAPKIKCGIFHEQACSLSPSPIPSAASAPPAAMVAMPSSNRDYVPGSSAGGLPLCFDVESPANDIAARDVSSVSPSPPLLSNSRLRPLPMKVQPPGKGRRRSPSSYLKCAWQQVASRAWASPNKELTAAATAAAASPFGDSARDDHAPASAEGIYEFANGRQQPQQHHQQQQPRRHWSGSGRGRRSWVRLKVIGCKLSLVFVAGALTFDLYLANLGSHANEDSGDDILFASFPTENNLLGQKPSSLDARHSQRRGRDTGNGNVALFEGDTWASPSYFGHGVGIKYQVGQASVKARRHHSIQVDSKTGVALDDAISERTALSKPGGNQGGHGSQQLLRLDPFDGQRVAVVVPYVGRDLPAWWDAFAVQAGHNDGLIDWIIFCDQASPFKRQ